MGIIELEQAVAAAKNGLIAAVAVLAQFIASPENNIFDSIEQAVGVLEDRLRAEAHEDCEGAGNCGAEEYEQEFIVDGVHYEGKLNVSYGRHDKTYYFIDSCNFTFEPVDRDGA